ncbi:hemolysin secretion protein D [Roseobacter cerasinus]|uniref:Hemolysin secretion protein D n=1 Tax=Roseobacter cerasinus TaxID=2602289 RepID=A0A640VRL5_9RHOB|nr:efflux RND transporter periplasmic adaptor subunit [Roseobacter cerasinus]GFE50659.1 hemolysin secretion protein D [Roseobacter cerasinus]
MVRTHLTIVATVLMSAWSLGPAVAQDSSPRPAKVFTVEPISSSLRRTYPAIVRPSSEVDLSFRVSGRVTQLPVRAAAQVSEGDLIAALDPRDFETQIVQLESQIDQASAELTALRAGAREEEIAALEAAVFSAEAQLEQARDQEARTRELVQRGVATSAQLEQDEANLRVAEANLRAQTEQLRIGRAGGRPEDIAAAEAAIRGLQAQLKVARDNLDDSTLEAPFNGIIARRDIENFTNVQAGQTIALLQALSVVHLAFDVPGPDVTALSANGTENIHNEVSFDALPGVTFPGEVVEFSVQADAATQTYRGRVAVTVPEDALILPGMVGRVMSTAAGEEQALMIPMTAVGADPSGAPFVWQVGADNTVSQILVDLGDMRGDMVAVTEGLAPGDTIVSAGVSRIIDGMTIRPVTRIGG